MRSNNDDTKTPVSSKTQGILKGGGESSAKPMFDYKNLKKGKTTTTSPSK
jgi:hypothetical protein